MNFLNKMERKYGRFAIKNLTLYIILTYVLGLVLTYSAPSILELFLLEPYYILRGEVWRIISWIFLPGAGFDIWTIIMLVFYYSIGRQLERAWGDFRYNVYIFGGILCVIISSFVLYFIIGANTPFIVLNDWFDVQYICLSLFFGYAMTCPDQYVLLYFIIPIKMKWMALIALVPIVLGLISGSILTRTAIIAAMVNFLIFFGLTRGFKTFVPRGIHKPIKRRSTFTRAVSDAKRASVSDATQHKCAVCGKTELDGDDLEFRYCSKCEGDYEYCQDHLFTHKHIKKS